MSIARARARAYCAGLQADGCRFFNAPPSGGVSRARRIATEHKNPVRGRWVLARRVRGVTTPHDRRRPRTTLAQYTHTFIHHHAVDDEEDCARRARHRGGRGGAGERVYALLANAHASHRGDRDRGWRVGVHGDRGTCAASARMRGVVFVRVVSGVEAGVVARRGARWARVSLRDGRATVVEC